MPSALLVTGGARSGKSAFASRWILARPGPRIYLATARRFAEDLEMSGRIDRHQTDRADQGWQTVEEPLAVVSAIHAAAASGATALLLDCVTLWLTNLGEQSAWDESIVLAQVDQLAAVLADPPLTLAVVTNEVGLGIVPMSEVGRTFRDLQGWANQRLAAAALDVVFTACGLPLVLKSAGRPTHPV